MLRLARIGGSAKYCLIWIKSRSHCSFYPARLAPLRVAKNGCKRSVNREINRPKAANRPVSCYTSFLELGAGDSKMALSWEELASIPLIIIMNPRNRPALTSNAHFVGLSFIP